jgi:transporter family-2 protein
VTVTALGVALFTVCIVAGQTGNSLLVDRLGLAPGGVRHITAPRVFASVLVVGAVVIGVSDRWEVDDFNVWFVIFAAAAGGAAAFQQAFNAQVARVADSVTVSSLVNFIVGFLALGLLVGIMHAVSGEVFPPLPNPISGDWWLYLGGPMGVAYTLGLALVVRTLGVLVFGLCSIAGQLAGAVVIDLVAPTGSTTVGWQIITAVVLTFVAVVLAGRGTRTPPPLAAPAHAAE